MLHDARSKATEMGNAQSQEEVQETAALLHNVLESAHHLVMAFAAGTVTNLQTQFAKFCKGPSMMLPEDDSTAIDADYWQRYKVIPRSFHFYPTSEIVS
jgi:hypothetical protein